MSWFRGNVTLTQDSQSVTYNSGDPIDKLKVGFLLVVDGDFYEIIGVDNTPGSETVTLFSAFSKTGLNSGDPLTVDVIGIPTAYDFADATLSMRELAVLGTNTLSALNAWATSTNDTVSITDASGTVHVINTLYKMQSDYALPVYGGVSSNNGLAWVKAPNGGSWTPATTTTDLTFTFSRGASVVSTHVIRATLDPATGYITTATEGAPSGEATTFSRIGNGTSNVTVTITHNNTGIAVPVTVQTTQGGTAIAPEVVEVSPGVYKIIGANGEITVKDGLNGDVPTLTDNGDGTYTIDNGQGQTLVVSDGEDGYSPIHGVDYFDGANGDFHSIIFKVSVDGTPPQLRPVVALMAPLKSCLTGGLIPASIRELVSNTAPRRCIATTGKPTHGRAPLPIGRLRLSSQKPVSTVPVPIKHG
ncbi:hypothetical protein ACFQMB_14410 [Pseudobowmanella zhangzhouensis]|uniref:hypothetical protein n=1 Tax=Pseudobowmanella zhangzhouensis TaxID=1537679 RepID=UPI00361C43E3